MTALQALTLARQQGITPSALFVLLTLLDDSPLGAGEVSKRIKTTPSAVTGLVDVLERDGWAVRLAGRDRRSKPIQPTEKAFEIFTPTLDEN